MNITTKPILGVDGRPLRSTIGLNTSQILASGLSNGAANLDSPTMSAWRWEGGSPDDDIVQYLPIVRQRCRDLALNAPIVAGILNTLVTHVVGIGLVPEPTPDWEALGISESDGPAWAAKWKRDVLRLWEDWAENKSADVCGRNNFYELTQLIFRSELESGDVFVATPYADIPGALLDLKIQVIEADCVSNPMSIQVVQDNEDVYGGVGVNEFGTVTSYYVSTQHPLGRRHPFFVNGRNPLRQEWVRVPMYGERTGRRNMLHVMRNQRPGQRRGIPALAPVVEAMKMLDRYCRAELQAALIQTLFTAAIKTQNPEVAAGEFDALGMDLANDGFSSLRDMFYAQQGQFQLGAGTVAFLAPGDDIQPIGVTHPSSQFGPFAETYIKMIGSSMGVPYEMAVQFFQTSFSASRAAINMATAGFEVWRDHLVSDFCIPIWETFLTEAIAANLIDAPGFFSDRRKRKAYCGAQWGGPGDLSIDAEKELAGFEKAIGLGLTTHTKAAIKYDGSEFRQNVQTLHEEQQLIDKYGWEQNPLKIGDKEAWSFPADGGVSVQENTSPMQKDVLAVQFGVGGTQALIDIITSDSLSDAQKVNVLIELFGLDEAQAKKMLEGGASDGKSENAAE